MLIHINEFNIYTLCLNLTLDVKYMSQRHSDKLSYNTLMTMKIYNFNKQHHLISSLLIVYELYNYVINGHNICMIPDAKQVDYQLNLMTKTT